MAYNKYETKESLEPEDIFTLLEYFGAEPEMFADYIICRTICHNGINEGSRKLYYYFNSQLFFCYSGCNESFDVFELVQKVKGIDSLNEAVFFVVNFFNLQYSLTEDDDTDYTSEDWKIFSRHEKSRDVNINDSKLELPEYDISVIEHYPQPTILPWERSYINKEVCDFMGIRYDPVGGNILIPHFDEDNRCVGIRQRTLIQEEETKGKYRPWKHQGILYNHPLSFSLYGYNVVKDRIAAMGTAIVCESEKAALQLMSYFGTANSLGVAVCGSSMSKYQFHMLQSLGIKEMAIAFDHDFAENGSDDYYKTRQKIAKVAKKFTPYVNVSVLFDEDGILDYKDSPTDQGPEKFMYLFKNRIMI